MLMLRSSPTLLLVLATLTPLPTVMLPTPTPLLMVPTHMPMELTLLSMVTAETTLDNPFIVKPCLNSTIFC